MRGRWIVGAVAIGCAVAPFRSAHAGEPEKPPPARAALSDLDAVLEAMKPLVGDPEWKLELRQVKATLEAEAQNLPPENRKGYLDGYENGRTLVARLPGEDVRVVTIALGFDIPAHAQAFVAAGRAKAQLKADAAASGRSNATVTLSDGAGREGSLPGYAGHGVVRTGSSEMIADTQVASLGRVVVEIMVVNAPSLDRTAQDEALERARRRIEDPTAPAPPPRVPGLGQWTRSVTIRVVDPEGKPVSKAQMTVYRGSGPQESSLAAGKAIVTLSKRSAWVNVYAAKDAEGKALSLAPKIAEEIPADVTEFEIRLEPGVTIEGIVTDEARKPVAGATVEVTAGPNGFRGRPGSGDEIHGTAVSERDGAFRIAGLGPYPYSLRARVDGGRESTALTTATGGARGVTVVVLEPK